MFADRHQTFIRSRNSNTWRATSQYHYLTDEEIAEAISSRSSLYRAFGNQEKTNFVVIQVQGGSNEAPVQTIKNLHKLLMQKSVKAKPYYLKELDIWQLFIFLSAPTPTLEATTAIENWLSTSWFNVDSETVDVLPNGSPLSIPLQAEFTWLNDDYEPILSASEISLENAASMFLRDLVDCSNMLESLSHLQDRDDQIDQPAYAVQEYSVDTSDDIVCALVELATIRTDDQLFEELVGSDTCNYAQADQAPILDMEISSSPLPFGPPLQSSSDQSEAAQLNLELTEGLAPQDAEAAYATNSKDKCPPDRASNVLRSKNTRGGPSTKQKDKPNIRSNLDSFQQLMLPFGSDTS